MDNSAAPTCHAFVPPARLVDCALRGFTTNGNTGRDLDAPTESLPPPRVDFQSPNAGLCVVRLSGDWTVKSSGRPHPAPAANLSGNSTVAFDLNDVSDWDSALLAWLLELLIALDQRSIQYQMETLPGGVRKSLELARAVPERTDTPPHEEPPGWLARVGLGAQRGWTATKHIAEFVGDCTLAMGALVRGRPQFRRADLLLFIQEAGAEALPINLLISFLVGLILAFVGAVQLQQFGASIYVANLVAIAMVREMGCIMAGIIMCGRTGAAYAAQLGTMKVNQEIDAFRTFLFNPIDFLVLPRMLALFFMMPILTLFANLAGIAGGVLIGIGMLDLTWLEYWHQTLHALTFKHCAAGFMKSFVFGLIVAISGCYNGMRCPNNAAGVGQATTTAVVAGITSIVIADAVFAVLFNIFNF